MSKRAKIEFAKTDLLQEIDNELDLAMDRLDGTNARVDGILSNLESEMTFSESPEIIDDSETSDSPEGSATATGC